MSDDKIEEIRARHAATEVYQQSLTDRVQMHDDRAFLLAEDERHRAEIERLRASVRQLEQVREAALNACADWYLSLRVDDRDGMEYVEPNRGLMKSMGKLSEIATEAKP